MRERERERERGGGAGECQKPMVGFGRGLPGVWSLFVLSGYMDKCLRAYAFINLTKLGARSGVTWTSLMALH